MVTVNYSEDNPLSLSSYKFTRTGYTLVGWTKDENNDEWVADCNGIIRFTMRTKHTDRRTGCNSDMTTFRLQTMIIV